jgi:hypothetical protein
MLKNLPIFRKSVQFALQKVFLFNIFLLITLCFFELTKTSNNTIFQLITLYIQKKILLKIMAPSGPNFSLLSSN